MKREREGTKVIRFRKLHERKAIVTRSLFLRDAISSSMSDLTISFLLKGTSGASLKIQLICVLREVK